MSNKTVKRGPGRPNNFPGQETVAFLAKIPTETKAMVTRLAERREEPVGVTLDRMIRQAFAASRGNKSGS